MGVEHAVRPAGCTCPWAQVHMDMPWQKLSTAADCPVHTQNPPPSQVKVVGAALDPDGMGKVELGEWIG